MDSVTTPQEVFNVLVDAFGHKNWRVRGNVVSIFETALTKFGQTSMKISAMLPKMLPLLADQNGQVREACACALTEVYRHVGERVRRDIERNSKAPQAKLQALFDRFDAVAATGTMIASPKLARGSAGSVDSAPSRASTKSSKSSGRLSQVKSRLGGTLSKQGDGGLTKREFIDQMSATAPVTVSRLGHV